MESNLQPQQPAGGTNLLLPLTLIVLALVTWFGFQFIQALRAKDNLEQVLTAQETQFQNSTKIRQSLSALAMATKQLASQGNANASLVVNNLAARGINIADPQAQAPTPPPPAKP